MKFGRRTDDSMVFRLSGMIAVSFRHLPLRLPSPHWQVSEIPVHLTIGVSRRQHSALKKSKLLISWDHSSPRLANMGDQARLDVDPRLPFAQYADYLMYRYIHLKGI